MRGEGSAAAAQAHRGVNGDQRARCDAGRARRRQTAAARRYVEHRYWNYIAYCILKILVIDRVCVY